jgi:hypothetical protein
MTQDEAFEQLNIIVDLIPAGSSNRPSSLPGGDKIQPSFITIHNTANASKGADALMHAKYVKGPDARARKVSWHFTVDDKRCVKHLPTNEKGWHAGAGNSKSIGIEVCENKGIDEDAAVERASLLAAVLMFALNIPPDRIVSHQHWTGKDCPHIILRRPGGFNALREQAADFLSQLEEGAPAGVAPLSAMAAGAGALGFEATAGGLSVIADQIAAVQFMGFGPGGITAPMRSAASEDPIQELERLVGRLTLENERLRRALKDMQDVTLETD